MTTCSVPDCGVPAVARNLCAKHYMRARRRGDANSTGKPGRPRSEDYLKAVRQWFPDSSPRTQARWARIYRLILALEECKVIEDHTAFLKTALAVGTRSNGSVNVSRVLDYVTAKVAFAVLAEEDAGASDDRR
jgi:hypothetical protein